MYEDSVVAILGRDATMIKLVCYFTQPRLKELEAF